MVQYVANSKEISGETNGQVYSREPEVCVEVELPVEQWPEGAALSIEENAANLPPFVFPRHLEAPPVTRLELAITTAKLWANGRRLRVRFMSGTPAIQQKIVQYAKEWEKYANITFDFGNDPDAEIRIDFANTGSWSYIGTDALLIPRNQATMNYGWFNSGTTEGEFSRVTIHEFGHALGCIHEHQSPVAGIPWDEEAVYRYYERQGWDRQKTFNNVLSRANRNTTQYTVFDPKSIMLYPVPEELTVGNYQVGWNRELSDTDKNYIASVYPKPPSPTGIQELTVNGNAVEAAIGAHGELDLFQFNAVDAGQYVVETFGPTDVVMSLYGPGSATTLIASDDDSGQGLNARISAGLQPGTYTVRVQHYNPQRTGNYRVGVRK